MAAFVTGGSGFVGRALIAALVARGDRVRALARSGPAAACVARLGAEVVRGDLDDTRALAAGMAGCTAVFHAAAKVEVWGAPADFERVNIVGTRNALTAAQRAGVARFVHVSSEAVLADGAPLCNVDEARPLPERPLGLYPWSKGRAELEVQAAARAGLHAVIVRPRAIWGAGDSVLLPRLCALVDGGRFRWIGGGHALTSTCHVDNVCAGLLRAAEAGRTGEAYFVTDGLPVTFRDYLGGLLATQGRDVSRVGSVPLWLARQLAVAAESYWAIRGKLGEPPLTRTAVALVGQEVTVSDLKARRELGYAPVVARDAGLAALRSAAAQGLSAPS